MAHKRISVPKIPPSLVVDDRPHKTYTESKKGKFTRSKSSGANKIDDIQSDNPDQISSSKRWRWFSTDDSTDVTIKELPPVQERVSLDEPKDETLYYHIVISKPIMIQGQGDQEFNQRRLPTPRRGWMIDKERQARREMEIELVEKQFELLMKGGTDQDELGFLPELPPKPSNIRGQYKVPRERFLGTGFADDNLDYRRIAPTGQPLSTGEITNVTQIINDF